MLDLKTLLITAALAAALAGCARQSPASSATSRNVGPASSVTGVPQSDMGNAGSGNSSVPGAPSTKGANGGGSN